MLIETPPTFGALNSLLVHVLWQWIQDHRTHLLIYQYHRSPSTLIKTLFSSSYLGDYPILRMEMWSGMRSRWSLKWMGLVVTLRMEYNQLMYRASRYVTRAVQYIYSYDIVCLLTELYKASS